LHVCRAENVVRNVVRCGPENVKSGNIPRLPKIGIFCKLLFCMKLMARPEGFEPPTLGSEGHVMAIRRLYIRHYVLCRCGPQADFGLRIFDGKRGEKRGCFLPYGFRADDGRDVIAGPIPTIAAPRSRGRGAGFSQDDDRGLLRPSATASKELTASVRGALRCGAPRPPFFSYWNRESVYACRWFARPS
jgi:hypothetical protein